MTQNEAAVHRVLSFAKHTVLWISLLLLIKGHNDQQKDILFLRKHFAERSLPQHNNLDNQKPASPKALLYREPKTLGDFYVAGNLMVDKCILWQQPMGVFQNSCTVFRQTHYDCVHGIMEEIGNNITGHQCRCDPNWWGNLCDMHDCYGRGIFSVSSGKCACFSSGFGKLCEILEPTIASSCDKPAQCQGTCMDNKCVCNKKGQLGQHCHQCASPLIDPALCPGRTDWSQPYVLNESSPFFVCGGGYVPFSPDILILRYTKCETSDCKHEHDLAITCCNPLAFSDAICPGWGAFIYNLNDFPNTTNTVFNTGYQLRYMAILNAHHPLSVGCIDENPLACLARAANLIHSSDWPLLRINHLPNQAYYLQRGQLYLGLATANNNMHANEASWVSKKTPLYMKPSGTYDSEGRFQYYYVMHYESPRTLCLGKEWMDPQIYVDMFTSLFISSLNNQTAYWINLRDQPGQALNVKSFCGLFKIDNGDLIKIDTDNIHAAYYLGPYKNKQVKYWISKQNALLTTL